MDKQKIANIGMVLLLIAQGIWYLGVWLASSPLLILGAIMLAGLAFLVFKLYVEGD